MSNCRNNRCYKERRCNYNRPSRRDRGCGYNSSYGDDSSDSMGGRRVRPGGEHCPHSTPRAWQNSKCNKPCR